MSKPRPWPKLLSIWMNAIADAWNMGEAPWAFDERGSVAVRLWCSVYATVEDEMLATEAVRDYALERGVDPKRHKVGAR